MTSAFFDWPSTGVARIGAGAVPVDRTLRTVARSFVLCRMDDLRVDLGLGVPRPALLAALELADGFMIRTSYPVFRRRLAPSPPQAPSALCRLGLWGPRFRPAAGDQRHARSVRRGSPVDLSGSQRVSRAVLLAAHQPRIGRR